MSKTLLVTGGAGFIGSSLIHKAVAATDWNIINIDKLTYSGNLSSLSEIENNPRYNFIHGDIADMDAVRAALETYKPDAIMNLAAESHVDRSIDDPSPFIETNIKGTFILLEETRRYWKNLQLSSPDKAKYFRFHHISTDEVFGDLAEIDGKKQFFSEKTPYAPSSPYSASKASSDHLIRAWHRTYGLPTLITNCSNNYGPRQFPEKLIPLMIISAMAGKPLPVYGTGSQIRDWLYVDDHVDALLLVLERGLPGETYAIGGNCEKTNIEIVHGICSLLEELIPEQKSQNISHYNELITFVQDRPGHDARYAIDASKISSELGWKPKENFSSGLRKTVQWYLNNKTWWKKILDGTYRCQRLGTNI